MDEMESIIIKLAMQLSATILGATIFAHLISSPVIGALLGGCWGLFVSAFMHLYVY